MWPYKYAHDVAMVTLFLNIYGFVGLAPFDFLAKVPLLAFLIQKGVWSYRHTCDVPLVVLILNTYMDLERLVKCGQVKTVK